MRIAINGAGIAGTTLAYWLHRFGHEPVLFEEAPKLRAGGYVIDFWGAGYEVAERMGLIPDLERRGYDVGEWRVVDADGRKTGGFSTKAIARLAGGRVVSLQRSDLAAAIYDSIQGKVETVFGDSIAGIAQRTDGVRVSFDRSPPRDFDLVIGADGLHSRVRRLAFGPEQSFERHLGYHVAAFEAEGYRPREELVYVGHNAPGRQISRFSMRGDRTLFLFVFRSELLEGRTPATDLERKAALRAIFGGMGWETPGILTAMDDAHDIYFDRVSQIWMEGWTKGRVGLVGDAAACVSLIAGEGSGLAMAEAYVLAGELAAGNDHKAAFARYEEKMMPFVRDKQDAAGRLASSFAPATRLGIFVRDLATKLMSLPYLTDFFLGRSLRNEIELPVYEGRERDKAAQS